MCHKAERTSTGLHIFYDGDPPPQFVPMKESLLCGRCANGDYSLLEFSVHEPDPDVCEGNISRDSLVPNAIRA